MAELLDNFTGANGTELEDHTADSGESWVVDNLGPAVINSNAVSADADLTRYQSTWVPASADYEVTMKVSITDGLSLGGSIGMGPAFRAGAGSGYAAYVERTQIAILRVNAAFLSPKAYSIANGTYNITMGGVGPTLYMRIQRVSDSKWLSPNLQFITQKVACVVAHNTAIATAGAVQVWLCTGSGATPPTVDQITTAASTSEVYATTPTAYRVLQRGANGKASMTISGQYVGAPTAIEASWNGGAYETIDAAPASGAFSGTLADRSGGQGSLIVRFTNNTAINSTNEYVGVGEIIIGAGQSNMQGVGTNNQVYSHATLKACLFGNDYVYKELVDPWDSNVGQLDAVSDGAGQGSYIPHIATGLMAALNVPVMFVPCPHGGTTILQWAPGGDHLDRGTLYGSMNYRAQQVGGVVRLVILHIGESDALNEVSQATFNSRLDTFANAVEADIDCPTMACLLQNSSGIGNVFEQAIRDAVTEAVGDNANVLLGPDLSDLTSDDDYHLQTDGKLETAGERWSAAILESGLVSSGGFGSSIIGGGYGGLIIGA